LFSPSSSLFDMGAQQILNILLIFRRTHEQILMRKMQLGLLKA